MLGRPLRQPLIVKGLLNSTNTELWQGQLAWVPLHIAQYTEYVSQRRVTERINRQGRGDRIDHLLKTKEHNL